MRVHFLHLQRSSFTLSNNGQTWQSAVIDLYDNPAYTNYSLVRSNYGLGAISTVLGGSTPNDVWVGMQVVGSTPGETLTDSGIIRGGRFIDTSGPINIVSYNISTPEYTSSCTLDIYQSYEATAGFPAEWVTNLGNTISGGLSLTASPRYAVLVLNWNYDPGSVDFYLRVEIDQPIMTPKYKETSSLLAKLPGWMAMSESGYAPATPELATPHSVGGSYINAVAGQWLDDIFSQLSYRQAQLYIDTADISHMAWCYTSSLPPTSTSSVSSSLFYPYSFVGDGVQCTVAYDTWEFYQSDPADDIVLWDEPNQKVYSNKRYNNLTINGVTYPQLPFQVWNPFDDLGLLVGLTRLPGEDNATFRLRILDVYINQPGAGVRNFQNAVRRELNLWGVYGSTPDSSYAGATPAVLEISDLENDPVYMTPNGLPTSRFVQLANYLSSQYPTTWGQFRWDAAYADFSDETFEGYSVLPLMHDATPWGNEQSGVGDQRDLLIYPPAPLQGAINFSTDIILRGKTYASQTQHLPIEIDFSVTPYGTKTVYTNPVETVWFTLVFGRYDSGEVDYYSFQLSSTSDVYADRVNPSSASVAAFQIFDTQGVTVPDVFLRNIATGAMTGQRLLSTNISSLSINVGQWDPRSQIYTDIPANTFTAWLTSDPTTLLTNSSVALTIDNNIATPSTLPPVYLLMQSQVTDATPNTWVGDTTNITVIVNNTGNVTTTSPSLARLPPLNWDPYVSSGQGLTVNVTSMTILNLDGSATAIDPTTANLTLALTDVTGTEQFSSQTVTTGAAVFTDAELLSSPVSLSFTLNSAPNYPVVGTQATAFSHAYPAYGTVDQHGPWVHGFAPAAGNNNFLLGNYTFQASDFGIGGNYELDWVGAQTVNEPSVITWLGSNTPTLNADGTHFTVSLYARLAPDPLPQWNPSVHGGIYFENNQESYLFVNPQTLSFSGGMVVLPTAAQQGAPVLVSAPATPDSYYRQVAFFNYDATPYELSLINAETVSGNGTTNLYLAYPNIWVMKVVDVTDPNHLQTLVSNTMYVSTNVVPVGVTTDPTHSYQVTYEVVDSFYIDNNYQSLATPLVSHYELATPGEDVTQSPRAVVVTSNPQPAMVIYESSVYATATPTSVPLSPLYTVMEEGFIYLSHDDYPLDHFEINLSPSSLVADGEDYALLSVYAYDANGNPAPNQHCLVKTTYTLANGSNILAFVTDFEGHAVVTLVAPISLSAPSVADAIMVSSTGLATPIMETTSLALLQPPVPTAKLRAAVTQSSIRANGTDLQMIYGQLLDGSNNPISGATITWAQARTNFDLYSSQGSIATPGATTTSATGQFFIGPLTANIVPGYWLLSVQATQYNAGDVVYWLEYPDNTFGAETIDGLPTLPIQMATPTGTLPPYTPAWQHPVYYTEATPVVPATPNAIPNWLPPTWYALPQFTQWQLGLYTSTGTAGDWSAYINSSIPNHPTQPNE